MKLMLCVILIFIAIFDIIAFIDSIISKIRDDIGASIANCILIFIRIIFTTPIAIGMCYILKPV